MTSTYQAAFFIGGQYGSSISSLIAKYENDAWFLHGNLKRRRKGHKSITFGTETIVIGGKTDDGSSVMNKNFYQYIKYKLSVIETEIWNFSNNENKIVDPALQDNTYLWGVGHYLVPTGFCGDQ